MYIPQLNKYSLNFPNPCDANEEGIVAWGGDLGILTKVLYFPGIWTLKYHK